MTSKPFRLCEHCLRGERRRDGICPLCRYDGVPRNRPPLLPEGTAVGGRYVLGRREGQGGFSICYRAWDGRTDEIVAVKELFPNEVAIRLNDGAVAVRPEHREDFDAAVHSLGHEAEVLRKLTAEPAIIKVLDVFGDNGTAYLSMEYLRGRSYEQYLQDQFAGSRSHIGVETAVNVALTILSALDAVHGRGLLHLDVKPANIRVLDNGSVVLLDFGSARNAFRLGNAPYGDTFTPGFAALEQHFATDEATAATDVYGLAATLYYSLSLAVPTRADDRARGAPLPALSVLNRAVPEALDVVIQKAMALAPRDRYSSVTALRRALEPFGSLRPSPHAPSEQPGAATPPKRIASGPSRVVTPMLLLLAVIATVLVLLYYRQVLEQITAIGR